MRTSTRKTNGTKGSTKTALVKGLTVEEARHLAKPHVGFEAHVEPLAQLYEAYPDDMGTSGIDVAKMRAAQTAVVELTPRLAALRAELALVEKTLFVHSSTIWTTEMLIYGRARQAARTNVDIKREIEPFAKFMKRSPRKKVTVPSTPPSATKPTT